MLLVFFWFHLATYDKFGECLSITGHDVLVFFWFHLATYNKFGKCLSITGRDALGVLLVSSNNL